jgi:hypothetical protein
MFSLAFVPAAEAAPLRLDAGFGVGGIARARFSSTDDLRALRPVRQTDGKVLVAAANYFFHGNSQILIARFTRRGRPDPTFGDIVTAVSRRVVARYLSAIFRDQRGRFS